MITPSNHQLSAVREVVAWFRAWQAGDRRRRKFELQGAAGTGKTALASFIVRELGLDMADVAAACPTGKAAHVLRGKGFPQAQTIHSLIYRVIQKGRGKVPELEAAILTLRAQGAPESMIRRIEKEIKNEIQGLHKLSFSLNIESDLRGAKLLIVDERSMVPDDVAEDLFTFGVPILFLGDPYQLPPVKGAGLLAQDKPDALLTEIHRQAAKSAVIRLATWAREGKRIDPGDYPDEDGPYISRVVIRPDPARLLSADQIIVGRNATRHRTNAWMRYKLGRESPLPVACDRLVCLRNNASLGLMNGALYTAAADAVSFDDDYCTLSVTSDDFPEIGAVEMTVHARVFGHDPKDVLQPWDYNEAELFDYGYALTVHKFQGSQANTVALKSEWTNTATLKQWLYTGLSRAQHEDYVILG